MISFKSFVTAIHDAIVGASNELMDKNISLLDKYFIETTTPAPANDTATDDDTATGDRTVLKPKTVIMEYPHMNAAGNLENLEIAVPLITLAPLNLSQIEKVTLTADFDLELSGNEVWLSLAGEHHSGGLFRKSRGSSTKLEITLVPQETPEGMKMLVEGYEAILKRQLS
ncbi:MAG: DUF2589 domain-containing protein [Bacteroidota bacterium]